VLKIYCYRDNLEGEKYRYFGVNLYFAQDISTTVIYEVIKVKKERKGEVTAEIEKLLSSNDPVLEFVRMCVESGTGKTVCYDDATEIPLPIGSPFRKGRRTHVSIRKQTQLALYDYLEYESENEEEIGHEIEEQPTYEIYERVQEFFAVQLGMFMGGMMYETSELSECDAPKRMKEKDFVFEIGRLQTGRFEYYGHYRNGQWLSYKMFDDFDDSGLEEILGEL